MKKYKLTDETIKCSGRKLYRIEALIDFSNVKAGDKGGYVQSEDNLSQKGCVGYMAMLRSMVMLRSFVVLLLQVTAITSYSRIGGAADDISLGHGVTTSGK